MDKEFIKSAVDDFIAFEKENEKADNTIILYRRVVNMFVDFFDKNDISKMDIIDFKRMLEKKYSPSTVKNHITIVNKFIKFAEILDNGDDPYEIRTHNSKMILKNIKIQQVASIDNVLEPSEYKRMIRKAKEIGMNDMYMIMKIFAHTGIRVSELKFFTVENVKKNYITVNNKGKIREIILTGNIKREILSYCKDNGIREGMIFNLSYYTIYYRMKKIASKCRGISLDKVHPHSFRHLFAINYLESGGQVTDLMDILGHNSIQTTSLYTRTTNKTKKRQLEKIKY